MASWRDRRLLPKELPGETALEDQDAVLVRRGAHAGQLSWAAIKTAITALIGAVTLLPRGLNLTPQAAEPTGVNVALSTGAASTNGFGSAGAGLYVKTGSAWARV